MEIAVTPRCEVWVVDSGNAAIYRWTCAGREIGTSGRKGNGPGEFQAPWTIAELPGDTIGIWDRPLQRLSSFASDGRFLRSERLGLTSGQHGFVRAVWRAGGRTFAHTVRYPTDEPRPDENQSYVWELQPDGNVGRALLRMPGPETIIDRGPEASARIDAPFRRVPVVLGSPDGTVLVGNSGSSEFRRYRAGPRMVPDGVLRLSIPAVSVTRRDRRAWLDSMRTRLAEDRERGGLAPAARAEFEARHERLLDRVRFPETHPLYQLVIRDERGNLWLQLTPARPGVPVRWQVHDGRTGARLRTIELTTSNKVLVAAARGGALYTVELDADGVAQVVGYAPRRR